MLLTLTTSNLQFCFSGTNSWSLTQGDVKYSGNITRTFKINGTVGRETGLALTPLGLPRGFQEELKKPQYSPVRYVTKGKERA